MVFIKKRNKIDEQEITAFTAWKRPAQMKSMRSRVGSYYQRRRPTILLVIDLALLIMKKRWTMPIMLGRLKRASQRSDYCDAGLYG